jgi:hypothetical protein
LKGLKPHTRSVYEWYLGILLRAANITPEQVLKEAKKDTPALWRKLKPISNTITSERGRYMAIYALRRFLIDNGFEELPRARITKPRRVKPPTYLTWDQALAICAAASRPYNLMFKLMLHSGWGIGEFFTFNTEETWKTVSSYLSANPSAEYFRYNFPQRKLNVEPFYSLVPSFILREITASGVYLPLSTRGRKEVGHGVPLNSKHYHTAQEDCDAAFKTAVSRAPIVIQGKPTPHDLRDTFRTRAEFVNCRPSAAEFAMGHNIDPLEYNKCFRDEAWLWGELKKIIGPAAITEAQLAERDKTMAGMKDTMRYLTECRISEIEKEILSYDGEIQLEDNTPERIEQLRKDEGEYKIELERLRAMLKGL